MSFNHIHYLTFELNLKEPVANISFTTVTFFIKVFYVIFFLGFWFQSRLACMFSTGFFFEKYLSTTTRIKRYALLRSPFVNKKAREHFELRHNKIPLRFSCKILPVVPLYIYLKWFFVLKFFKILHSFNISDVCNIFFINTLFLKLLLFRFNNNYDFFFKYVVKYLFTRIMGKTVPYFYLSSRIMSSSLLISEFLYFFLKFLNSNPNFYNIKFYYKSRIQVYAIK